MRPQVSQWERDSQVVPSENNRNPLGLAGTEPPVKDGRGGRIREDDRIRQREGENLRRDQPKGMIGT